MVKSTKIINGALLKYCIARGGYSGNKAAKALNMSLSAWQKKSTNKSEFTAAEIRAVQELVSLTDEEVLNIFIRGIDKPADEQ